MSGVKGKSGGYRPGAGRKPSASTINKKAKAKAKKVESLGEAAPLPDTIKFKKLTAFFAKPTADTVSTPQPQPLPACRLTLFHPYAAQD